MRPATNPELLLDTCATSRAYGYWVTVAAGVLIAGAAVRRAPEP
ncbi:hypothetical protein [Streptomyces aureocirculatus]|nr:hypothetical protein [Streptomyces aureocirculatus]